MESFRDPIILSSIAFYMLLCIGVGIWAMRRTTTTRDFFMAGRQSGSGIAVRTSVTDRSHGFCHAGGDVTHFRDLRRTFS